MRCPEHIQTAVMMSVCDRSERVTMNVMDAQQSDGKLPLSQCPPPFGTLTIFIHDKTWKVLKAERF
jgi:hypothetical protein